MQWDPERDIMATDKGKGPRKMLRLRAIQIGLSRDLSKHYVGNILRIQDVTDLAHRIGRVHKHMARSRERHDAGGMDELANEGVLPRERPYMPHVPDEILKQLALAPGPAAEVVYLLGLGKARFPPSGPVLRCVNES